MVKLNFKNPQLEKMFRMFKWARNNTVQIFGEADKGNILSYKSTMKNNSSYEFQPLLFQFQCIVTTTDTYYRKLTYNNNQQFGILIRAKKITPKKDIPASEIKPLLEKQIKEFDNLFKNFDVKDIEKNIENILSISNHEYLHQGQMIVAFREAGVELPERYKKAWAL
jgi:hypothetical protein